MKINILDAHDRLKSFKKNDFDIGECCQNIINQRPFGNHAFYIFAHPRTDDDGTTKRMIWQPRLTVPKCQTNSMLFKVNPFNDVIDIKWIIPERHLWNNFLPGMLTENPLIASFIELFQTDRERLEAKGDDDLSDEKIDMIYRDIANQKKYRGYPIL